MSRASAMSILLVEDEALIAMDIEAILEGAGYERVATTSSVAAALREIDEQKFDCALLDLNVGGEVSLAVAEELARRDIPFVLVTGQDVRHLPDALRSRPVIRKPYGSTEIVRTLDALFQTTTPGSADTASN